MKITAPNPCLVSLLALVLVSAPVLGKEAASLKKCQAIKNKMTYYTRLRRSGGSAHAMEGWKRKWNDYDDKYTHLSCAQWGSRLK